MLSRVMLDFGQGAEHFEEQVGGRERGHAGRVVDGRDLHEVTSDHVQAAAAADDFQGLGANAMILQIFSPKNLAKILAFFAQTTARF
jgi:hypothetical protein